MVCGAVVGMMPGLGAMPDPSKMAPAEIEAMARQMGIDPASLPKPAPQPALGQKLPTDVGQLLKSSGPGLPGPGAGKFPGLPGLGGGFVPRKK